MLGRAAAAAQSTLRTYVCHHEEYVLLTHEKVQT